MKTWIARNKDGQLHLFNQKPIKYDTYFESPDSPCILIENINFDRFMCITWENSPICFCSEKEEFCQEDDSVSKHEGKLLGFERECLITMIRGNEDEGVDYENLARMTDEDLVRYAEETISLNVMNIVESLHLELTSI